MNEMAKTELEHRCNLYQFYVGSYIKGLAFYIAATGALVKFAVDSENCRTIFAAAGIPISIASLVPMIYAMIHLKTLKADFERPAKSTGTSAKYLSLAHVSYSFFSFLGDRCSWMVPSLACAQVAKETKIVLRQAELYGPLNLWR